MSSIRQFFSFSKGPTSSRRKRERKELFQLCDDLSRLIITASKSLTDSGTLTYDLIDYKKECTNPQQISHLLCSSEVFAIICLSKENKGNLHCGRTCCGLIIYALMVFDLVGLGLLRIKGNVLYTSNMGNEKAYECLKYHKHLRVTFLEIVNYLAKTPVPYISVNEWMYGRLSPRNEMVCAIGGRDWIDMTMDNLVGKKILRKEVSCSTSYPRFFVAHDHVRTVVNEQLQNRILEEQGFRSFNLKSFEFKRSSFLVDMVVLSLVHHRGASIRESSSSTFSLHNALPFFFAAGVTREKDDAYLKFVLSSESAQAKKDEDEKKISQQ